MVHYKKIFKCKLNQIPNSLKFAFCCELVQCSSVLICVYTILYIITQFSSQQYFRLLSSTWRDLDKINCRLFIVKKYKCMGNLWTYYRATAWTNVSEQITHAVTSAVYCWLTFNRNQTFKTKVNLNIRGNNWSAEVDLFWYVLNLYTRL